MSFTESQRQILLDTARRSIVHGLTHHCAFQPEADTYEPALREKRATFVTLTQTQNLRGCIGTLEAMRPLIEDTAYHAYAAAFQDPRFPPLQARELDSLHLHISVLSPSVPMRFQSEEDLLAQLRPGIDGLVLQDGPYKGTFLPSVWESLPSPELFWQHLKRKAGLPAQHWSDTLKVFRYTTESIG